jgi:L-threonylcarbamoyladenylate synthase
VPVRTHDPDRLAACLAEGLVALMRTDTLPGLHALADHEAAVARILDLKDRPDDKPLLLLCATADKALAHTLAPSLEAVAYARTCWPGPFTLILPAGPAAPRAATRGRPTVALRVPQPPRLRDMIAAAGGALVSTSVNRTGEPPMTDLDDAVTHFGERVDVVGEMEWGQSPDTQPPGASTLLDVTCWPPRLVRAGATAPPPW